MGEAPEPEGPAAIVGRQTHASPVQLQRPGHQVLAMWANMDRKSAWLAGTIATALALGLIVFFAFRGNRGPVVHVTTSAVTEGPITRTTITTGTLAASKSVDVGVQVSGTVEHLSADFNARVHAGEVIARLDPRPFDADLMQANAALAQSEAEAARLRVLADDARVKLSRAQTLATEALISPADLDTARVAYEQAAADVRAGDAATGSARARLEQSRTNRAHTIIRSPIDGVVVNRPVEVGQTLNAAMNAPILFTIADLRHMLLLGEINEAEMGAVHPGAPVTFEIESRAGEQHTGIVSEVLLLPFVDQTNATTGAATTGGTVGTAGGTPGSGAANAPAAVATGGTTPAASPSSPGQTSQTTNTSQTSNTSQSTNTPRAGVVTYTAVVEVDNPDGAFAPGGTGLMTFAGDKRERAVRIPNNALTFRPTVDLLNSLGQEEPPLPQQDSKDPRAGRLARVWMFKDGRFEATTVRVGLANDAWTELLEGPIRPGDRLVTQASSK
jgi:RND family efflux transporter MFP subunit